MAVRNATENEQDLLGPNLTDAGNAIRFARRHGANVRYCHPWEKWLVWDGCRWKQDNDGRPQSLAKEVCRALQKLVAAKMRETEDEKEKERLSDIKSFALKSEASARLSAMYGVAQDEPGIPIYPDSLNTHPMLLCCPNGTVDLQTGEIREHNRADYLTQFCPTPYDPKAKCPTWLKTLADIFPAGDAAEVPGDQEMIGFLQRLLGYCLTGLTKEQVLPIWWGDGGNGKGTVINAITSVMGEDYSRRLPSSVLMASKGERHPTELATLFGRRFVVASETESGGRLKEALVKELTGSDKISCRRMKEDFWEFWPTHKIILVTNKRPRIIGRERGIWRRILLVPFAKSFGDGEVDKNREDKLRKETKGILAWMIAGCLEWQKKGFSEPASVREATSEYKESEDLISTWIAERCDVIATGKEKAMDLYSDYKAWMERGGQRYCPTAKDLYEELRTIGFVDHKDSVTMFGGIQLKPREP